MSIWDIVTSMTCILMIFYLKSRLQNLSAETNRPTCVTNLGIPPIQTRPDVKDAMCPASGHQAAGRPDVFGNIVPL